MSGRQKSARRFEPRYGVSQETLALEATYVSRERENYQLLSLADLKQKLGHVANTYCIADEALQMAIQALPERDQLIVRFLVCRDLYYILELYCTNLGTPSNAASTTDRALRTSGTVDVPTQTLPFSEWLFGGLDGAKVVDE